MKFTNTSIKALKAKSERYEQWEDNGKGFNPNQVTKTKAGMGISSIDKRVEHLDGKMTIESEKLKGTTVIIDIPL